MVRAGKACYIGIFNCCAYQLLARAVLPVVGETKPFVIVIAAGTVDLELSAEEISYLEEPYVSHKLARVMAKKQGRRQKKATCGLPADSSRIIFEKTGIIFLNHITRGVESNQ